MKYIDSNNNVWEFSDNDFDTEGNIINEIAKQKIIENNLKRLTEEEEIELNNKIEAEKLAEAERIASLPSVEEIEKAKMELVVINLLTEAGLV